MSDHPCDHPAGEPCAAVKVAADGTLSLVCRHTGAPLDCHLGDVRLATLHFDPADAGKSRAALYLQQLPVLSDSALPFSLQGSVIHVPHCSCRDLDGPVADEPVAGGHGD